MQGRHIRTLPRVSLEDARAWFLGLGLSASDGVKARAASKLCARCESEGPDADALTLALHAHCMADSTAGLCAHLTGLAGRVGPFALGLLVNRVLHVPLPTGSMMEVSAMTCAAMWERTGAKIRLLVAHGGRVDQCDSLGLYLEERLPSLPYVNHIALYSGGAVSDIRLARRNAEDTVLVCKELELLAGERDPPAGWHAPLAISQNLVPGSG